MTPTRRTFFASLAALVVAPKVLKASAPTEAQVVEWLSGFPEPRSASAEVFLAGDTSDHARHVAMHHADLMANDRIDIYAVGDHPHLDAANLIAWMRHVREHELAMKRVSGTRWIEDGR